MQRFSILASGLLCWFSCAAAFAQPSPAPPRIWSGLVLATNGANPGQPPEHLRKVAGKLKNIFGYNQFELVGEYSQKMEGPNESWLVPSKDFYMSVKSGSGPGGNHPMKIVLFQSNHRLAELEAHVSPDSPLFIRGPLYDRGQLVIVVRVADPSEDLERESIRVPAEAIHSAEEGPNVRERKQSEPIPPAPTSLSPATAVLPPPIVQLPPPMPGPKINPLPAVAHIASLPEKKNPGAGDPGSKTGASKQ